VKLNILSRRDIDMAITITRDKETKASGKIKTESKSRDVVSRNGEQNNTEVPYHRHCQNTILPILGHGDTQVKLEEISVSDELKDRFSLNETISDDLVTILEAINELRNKGEHG
jgi:hypothetical protein